MPTRHGRKGSFSIRTPEQARWDLVKQWLDRASDDLLAADLLIAGDLPAYWTASFHAQQAAEKALKALLTRHQIAFAKTHNIGELLLVAERVAPGLSQRLDAARDLTPHAVADRYPGDVTPVDRETARRHAGLARSVRDAVTQELQAYLEAGRPAS